MHPGKKSSSRLIWLLLIAVLLMSGCRSRGINMTITNTGATAIRNLEVDYPGGSFGKPSLEPNAPFYYRIRITGDGNLKVQFEANGKDHHENGPEVHADDDGSMSLIIDKDTHITWASLQIQAK